MPLHLNQPLEIRPTAGDGALHALLGVLSARVLPISGGEQQEGQIQAGTAMLAAAVQGSATLSSRGQYALLQPGDAFLLEDPGEYVLQSVTSGLFLALTLEGELVGRLLASRVQGDGPLFPKGAALVRETVLALAVLEEENPGVRAADASALAYPLLLKLRELPARLAEQEGLDSPLVEAAIAIIQEEFPFLEGIEDLAQRLEVSSAHLSRRFSQKTGISPGKYITRVRIEYAKLLLQSGDASVTYAAEASGFANANYFSKVFRRETGMSPSEYLQSAPRRAAPKPGRNPLLW